MSEVVSPSLELLLELLELRVPHIMHDDLVRTSEQVARELMGRKLLVQGSNLHVVTCKSCHDDHAAEVEFDPEQGFRHYCREAGWVGVAPERLRSFRVEVSAFLRFIMDSVDPERRTLPKELAQALVWEWGDVRLGSRRTRSSLWFARRLAEPGTWQTLQDLIRRRPPATAPRLILTSTPTVHLKTAPGDHLLIDLRDVLGDDLAVDGGILAARLGARPSSEGEPLTMSADGRIVRLYDQTFEFPRGDKQRQVITYLFRRLEAGDRQVTTAEIIADLNLATSTRVRDLFKGSPAWGELLTESKGVCRFCLRDKEG